MNSYSQQVKRFSDFELTQEITKCSSRWVHYHNVGSDKFYWYQALLEEQKERSRGIPSKNLAKKNVSSRTMSNLRQF